MVVLKIGTKWSWRALCYRIGIKMTLVPALKQSVLTRGGRMPLFLTMGSDENTNFHVKRIDQINGSVKHACQIHGVAMQCEKL